MGKRTANAAQAEKIKIDSPKALINRELSWLSFARRVLELVKDPDLPLLERVKFAGIMGMLFDEFAMKRIGGLKRELKKKKKNLSPDGLTTAEQLRACRANCINRPVSFPGWCVMSFVLLWRRPGSPSWNMSS